jgi:AraC-like DNA-binding protein
MAETSFCMRRTVSIPQRCRERYVPLEHGALASWRRNGVQFSGLSDLVPGYRIANPRPERIMLIVTISGAGWAVTPQAQHALTPGTLFVGVPGQPVGWGIDEGRWRIVWWYLQPAARWHAWSGSSGSFTPCPQAELLGALTSDLLDRLALPDDDLAPLTSDLLLRHLTSLAAAPESGPEDDAARFADLWREVARHPQEDWTLARLAERLDLSISTVQRVARAQLGMAPHRALVALRLGHARELLQRTSYPLATIAELAGYADAFTFSAAFKRWAGVPPSAVRGPG